MTTSVFADSESTIDEKLEKITQDVKCKVDIPDELKEFTYNIGTDESDGSEYYNLHWRDKSREVDVNVQLDGTITSYSNYKMTDKFSKLAKISYEDGLKYAKEFLKKAAPNYYEDLKEDIYVKPNLQHEYTYVFKQYVNGIKVLNSKVLVQVNKDNGEITEFNGLPTYKGKYASKDGIISREEAEKQYLNKLSIGLAYHNFSDYVGESKKVQKVYEIDASQGVIDAMTGEAFIPYKDKNYINKYGALGSGSGGCETCSKADTGTMVLTEEERNEVNQSKRIIPSKEIIDKVSQYFPSLKEIDTYSADLYKSIYQNRYMWRIEVTPKTHGVINVGVDAVSGEILSYTYLKNNDKGDAVISKEEAKEKVVSFLKELQKDKFNETKYFETVVEDDIQNKKDNTAEFVFKRFANGIPVDGDDITVKYNLSTDQMTWYYINWENSKFEDTNVVKDKKEIIKNSDLELFYVNKDKENRVPAYGYEGQIRFYDAFNGKRLNLNGKEYNEEVIHNYSDVNNHWVCDIAKKLYDSGRSFEDDKLKPDEYINQKDFFCLLLGESDSSDRVYKTAKIRSIIEDSEVNKEGKVTKEDAVKYLIKVMGYDKAAAFDEIYDYPFSDENKLRTGLKGYVALAYGFGIIDDKEGTSFKPNKELTRAEALKLIYNNLKSEEAN
jgi:hypothetical protein